MDGIVDYVNNNFSIDDIYYEIFNKPLPQNKCFCTEHHNTNTPAAKKYGNVIHCFSCNRNYDVYYYMKKYLPNKLKEVKETVFIETSERAYNKQFKVIPINRNNSVEQIVTTILSSYEV